VSDTSKLRKVSPGPQGNWFTQILEMSLLGPAHPTTTIMLLYTVLVLCRQTTNDSSSFLKQQTTDLTVSLQLLAAGGHAVACMACLLP
jgi:hypothetical protein